MGEALFDPRTVSVCRTGHGNVHFWLVRAMRKLHTQGLENTKAGILLAWALVLQEAKVEGLKPVRNEVTCSRLGMERWVAVGGSLRALGDAGLWGVI